MANKVTNIREAKTTRASAKKRLNAPTKRGGARLGATSACEVCGLLDGEHESTCSSAVVLDGATGAPLVNDETSSSERGDVRVPSQLEDPEIDDDSDDDDSDDERAAEDDTADLHTHVDGRPAIVRRGRARTDVDDEDDDDSDSERDDRRREDPPVVTAVEIAGLSHAIAERTLLGVKQPLSRALLCQAYRVDADGEVGCNGFMAFAIVDERKCTSCEKMASKRKKGFCIAHAALYIAGEPVDPQLELFAGVS